eukprot:TRINITY_DN2214_c0_g1_i1.p3 TRINITY_DN2214_c0_g1~~TRINITY_DN2214_c0_g1_i1.p3  ORF type:complete len:225 (-),score=28.73 TRINITY_DN2214_c0_g1_i1:248-922(-)
MRVAIQWWTFYIIQHFQDLHNCVIQKMFSILRRLIFGLNSEQTGGQENGQVGGEPPKIKFVVNVEGSRKVGVIWGKNVEINQQKKEQSTINEIRELLKDPRFQVPPPKRVVEPVEVLPKEHTRHVLLGPSFPTMAKEQSKVLLNAPDTQKLRRGQSFADQYAQMMRRQAHLNAGLASLPIAPDLASMKFDEEEEEETPEIEAPKPASVGLKAFVDREDKKQVPP